jgi:hypothetical protein
MQKLLPSRSASQVRLILRSSSTSFYVIHGFLHFFVVSYFLTKIGIIMQYKEEKDEKKLLYFLI